MRVISQGREKVLRGKGKRTEINIHAQRDNWRGKERGAHREGIERKREKGTKREGREGDR